MTTPAVNVSTSNPRAEPVKWFYGSTPMGTMSFNTNSQLVLDQRPASLSNPIRQTGNLAGTRPPRAWSHKELYVNIPDRKMAWNYTYYRYEAAALNVALATEVRQGCPGLLWVVGDPTGQFPYGLEARVRTQALTKLRKGDYSFGESLVEIGETVGFISDTVHQAARVYSSMLDSLPGSKREARAQWNRFLSSLRPQEIRSGAKRKYGPRVRNSANALFGRQAEKYMRLGISAWLALQFAVKPLLSDIDSAASALDEFLFEQPPKPKTVVVRTGTTEDEPYQLSLPYPFRLSGGVPAWVTTTRVLNQWEAKISAVYEIDTGDSRLADHLGLVGSPGILWEAIPWSWLGDYISNTGQWLQSLVPVEGARFVEGTLTKFVRVTNTQAMYPNPATVLSPLEGFGPCRWECRALRMERELLPAVGVLPAFRPVVRNRLNMQRMANSLAAFASAMGGGYVH